MNIKTIFCFLFFSFIFLSVFSETYSILYKQAETRTESIYKLLENKLQFSKEHYYWDIMEVRFSEGYLNDTIITIEYSKRIDFYSPQPSSCNNIRLFTVLAHDTIYVSGNLALSFFNEIPGKNQVSIDIESENMGIEFLPANRYVYNNGNVYSMERVMDNNPAYYLQVIPYLENKHAHELEHEDLAIIDSFRDLSSNEILIKQLNESEYSYLLINEPAEDYKDAPFSISDCPKNNPIVVFCRTTNESIGVLLLLRTKWYFYILSLLGNTVREEMVIKGINNHFGMISRDWFIDHTVVSFGSPLGHHV